MSPIDMPGLGRAVSLRYHHRTAQYPYFIPQNPPRGLKRWEDFSTRRLKFNKGSLSSP